MALRDLIGIPGIQGVNPTASAIARLTAPGAMPSAVMPMPAAAQPTLSPTAKYIQDMQALMSGGIGPLSTGEKISAVGQVLQAAGSRGATDPSAVIQNVRQQQMQKLNAQYQIAQMQQAQQQQAQQHAAIEKYKVALEPDQINALEGLPLEEQAKKVAEIAFRQDQVREIKRDSDGKTRYIFVSGKSKLADFDLPIGYEKIDTGNGFKFYNKDNPTEYLKDASGNEVFVPQQMTAYQRESLGLRRQEMARADARARLGAGGEASYQILNTTGGYVGVNRKNLTQQVPLGLSAPKSSGITIQGDAAQLIADRLKNQR